MDLPRYAVLGDFSNSCNLHYTNTAEDGDSILYNLEKVPRRFLKFELQKAKTGGNRYHIRCCHNGKYLVPRDPDAMIVPGAEEPNEDPSNESCTLFELAPKVNSIGVPMHTLWCVRSKKFTQLRPGWSTTRKDRIHATVEDGYYAGLYKVVDWQSLVVRLPRFVAFKGDNGKYLSAVDSGQGVRNYLKFCSTDINDPTVAHELTYLPNEGALETACFIKSVHLNRYWIFDLREWIVADSQKDENDLDTDSYFAPLQFQEGTDNIIGIRSLFNSLFCKRLDAHGKTDCLNASASTIGGTREAQLAVEEVVRSRRIDNVVYHLTQTRMFDETELSKVIGREENFGTEPVTIEMSDTIHNGVTSSWERELHIGLEVQTEIKTKIPFLVDGKISTKFDLSGNFKWGHETEKSDEFVFSKTVTVPKRTIATMTLFSTQGKCEIPFSYTQHDTLYNNEVVTHEMDDGLYTCLNAYNFNSKTEFADIV